MVCIPENLDCSLDVRPVSRVRDSAFVLEFALTAALLVFAAIAAAYIIREYFLGFVESPTHTRV